MAAVNQTATNISINAERTVQIKYVDTGGHPFLTVMTVPHPLTEVSPAELLMGRKFRRTLSILQDNVELNWSEQNTAQYQSQTKATCYYNEAMKGRFYLQ